jgi:predicted Zn-ribbon and HTH transcriptional regulator
MKALKRVIKAVLPSLLLRQIQQIRRARRSLAPIAERECNICGFKGWFSPFGRPARLDAQCPKCMSLERHRQLMLALDRGLLQNEPARVLHFAPEKILERRFRTRWGGAIRPPTCFSQRILSWTSRPLICRMRVSI